MTPALQPTLSPLMQWPALSFAMLCASVALGLCLAACAIRLWRGPSLPDRILAIDSAWQYATALVLVQGVRYATSVMFEVALLIALLGAISTYVASRYLVRGKVFD